MWEADETEIGGFDELTRGYWHRWHSSRELEYVTMDKPISCFRQKTNRDGNHLEKIMLGQDKNTFQSHRDENGLCIPKPEHRGITVRQLRAIWANIERRCEEEEWKSTKDDVTPLKPKEVTMYDIEKYILMPFTKDKRRSLVETLPSTAGAQTPVFSVSLSWSVSFYETLQCLEQFKLDFARNHDEEHGNKGGGMTEDTPIWMFAFAVRIEERREEDFINQGKDPCDAIFAKAIAVAGFRLLTIYHHEKDPFRQMTSHQMRLWPLLEVFGTLKLSDNGGFWAVYTAHPHDHDDGNRREAVGLCAGGAPSDVEAKDTLNREKHFPIEIVSKFLDLHVQHGEAVVSNDRVRILNKFIGRSIEEINHAPSEDHPKYGEFNDIIRAHFTTYGTLLGSLNQNPEHWEQMLLVMSKGKMKQGMRIDFRRGKGWDNLTDEQAVDLIRHCPRTIKSLEIYGGNKYGFDFLKEFGNWIAKSKNLEKLKLDKNLLGNITSDEKRVAMRPLARALLPLVRPWNIADQILTSLSESMNKGSPKYDKITFFLDAFIETGQPQEPLIFNYRNRDLVHGIIQWALHLDSDKKALLLSSKAGSFIKIILNEKFTRKRNLFIIMLDLYVQLAIVIAISLYMKNAQIVIGILYTCSTWISLREFLQMMTSDVKEHVKEVSNWLDAAQIGLVIWVIRFLQSTDTRTDEDIGLLVLTIFVVWSSLIFKLSHLIFPVSTFVTALVEITKGLIPFLFTTTLIIFMFAHMFLVQYSKVPCLVDDMAKGQDTWECASTGQSYLKAFSMFLTDGGWDFDDEMGIEVTFAFAFIVGVLLLNIVIGVVSNRFTDIQNDAENVFWLHRLSVVKELDSLWSFVSDVHSTVTDWQWLRHTYEGVQHGDDVEVSDNQSGMTVKQIIKRFSFSIIPSQREKEQFSSDDDLQCFTDWWFSTGSDPSADAPDWFERLYMFYKFSLWEDIIFPGAVFLRINLGLQHDTDFKSLRGLKYRTSVFLVKIFQWVAFIYHIFVFILVFALGLFFGLLWPEAMKAWMFHEKVYLKSNQNAKKMPSFFGELCRISQERDSVPESNLELELLYTPQVTTQLY